MQDISDLMDGELEADAATRQIARLKTDGAARGQWDTYHLIGDALRGDVSVMGGVAPVVSSAFTARFAEVLAKEPTVLAPRPTQIKSRMQTYLLSAAASFAAVAVVGGIAFSVMKQDAPQAGVVAAIKSPSSPTTVAASALVSAQPSQPTLSAASAPSLTLAGSAVHPQHMHEYLLAHQGISPTTAIQGVTPYIRTVTSNDSDD